MTIRTPSWLQAGSYPAENDRLLLEALLGGSLNTTPSVGIVGPSDFAVTASGTPDMNVHIATGAAFIQGTETTTQGVYGFVSDASVAVLMGASDGTNDRISLIVAQILDAGYSGASNIGQIVEVAGTPASSPVAPATPKNAIVLAQVRVPKLATSITNANITDKRVIFRPLGDHNVNVRAHRTAAWSTGTGGIYVGFVYDTTDSDPGGRFNASTGVYTVNVAGRYEVKAKVRATSSAVNQTIGLAVFKNGLEHSAGPWNIMPLSGANLDAAVAATVSCVVGDTLQLFAICSTAGLTGAVGTNDVYCTVDYQGLT